MRVIHEMDGSVVLEQEGVMARLIATCGACEFVTLTLQPGAGVAPHRLPIPVTFYIVHGVGQLTENQETVGVEAGQLIAVDPDQERSLRNTSEELLKVLVVKHVGQG